MSPLEGDLQEGERWTFDGDVTEAFDDMLVRSVPAYELMRATVAEVAEAYLGGPHRELVVDLGTSLGEAIARLRPESAERALTRFAGVELSAPMLAATGDRFREVPNVVVCAGDLRSPNMIGGLLRKLNREDADVILSVLTLQFTPIEHRPRILGEVHAALRSGGAFILVEKVLGSTPALDAMLVDRYYRGKREQGYSEDEIERKRLSLEGVLVPITAEWNEASLRHAGFREVECIWRALNFAGWVAVA